MKRVMFVIPALSGGGAERVVLYLLKYLDRQQYMPELVLFEKKGEFLHELSADIPVFTLKKNITRIHGLQWLVIKDLSKLLKERRPDILVSFMWYTNFISLLAGYLNNQRLSIVVSERYSLSTSYEGRIIELVRRNVIRTLYPRASKIMVNSEALKREIMEFCRINAEKIVTVYNPVDITMVRSLAKEDIDIQFFADKKPLVIAAGRLTAQKGFNFLIKAIHILKTRGLLVCLAILGQGQEEAKLKQLSESLGIKDQVLFLGFKHNPYKYIARASVFVLSSLYEGFPNVLLEAMALGVPSVATRCPTGPEEIITDGVNGILVPPADPIALAEAIERIVLDNDLQKRLGEYAKKRSEEFDVKKVVKEFEKRVLEKSENH